MFRKLTSALVLILIALSALAVITSCSSPGNPDYVGICTDPHTGMRIPDDYCDRSSPLWHPWFGWYYYPWGSSVVAVNHVYVVNGGTFRAPSGRRIARGGVPSRGGRLSPGSYRPTSRYGGYTAPTRTRAGSGSSGGFTRRSSGSGGGFRRR